MRVLLFFSLIFSLFVGCHSTNKQQTKHIYYLHGRIIEMQGKDAYSEEFGKYEIDSIADAIKVDNAIIHCEIRYYDVDVRAYAAKVSEEIDSLVNSGVKPSDITVIGASKGAIIACNISDMNTHDINYIFLGGNNDYQEKNNDWKFHGKVLCIYDLSDDIAGKDYSYWKQKENFTSKFEQIEIKTNLGHGFLYKPINDWVIPAKEWIISQTLDKIKIADRQTLYSQSYGDSSNPAIVYVHGGPSSNSALFEATTAQKIADRGFYVIAYDRRGEGRSADPDATFTFEEASNDLISIYNKYNIKKASILAHSFGGIVAANFAERHPEKINSIILVGALFSQQETYDHILDTVEKVSSENDDNQILSKLQEIRQLPKNTAEYREACFNFVDITNMPNPTRESIELREIYQNSDFSKNNIRNKNAPAIFFQNETLTNVDTKPVLKRLKSEDIGIYGIYGKEDNLFSEKQLKDLQTITGKENFTLIDNCSHFPYVDQQALFLKTIIKYMQ